jgi:hypothetical protein
MRGGPGRGQGRPKGSKNKNPRPAVLKPEELIRTRFLEAAKALVDSGELSDKMRFWLNHPNDHIAFQAFQTALAFAVGKPREQRDPDRLDLGAIIQEAAARARGLKEERREAYIVENVALRQRVEELEKGELEKAPAARASGTVDKQSNQSNTAPGGRLALPPASSPLSPEVLPPEPAEPQDGPEEWHRPTLRLAIFDPERK